MRRLLAATATASLVATACTGGGGTPAEDVAARAERVAELLDDGERCRALEAARVLQEGVDDPALDEEVRTAVRRWADQARQHLSCEDPTEAPTGGDPPSPADQDPPPRTDDGPERDEDENEGEGDGPPGQPGQGPGRGDDPGEGRGRGGGNGQGGGRGNG